MALALRVVVLLVVAGAGAACTDAILDDSDRKRLGRLGPLPPVPASPTNAVADDANARAFGHALFFDERMSADRAVACVSCHAPETGLADSRPLSIGAFGRVGQVHASTLVNVAYNTFQFWDGRADAIWNQAIQAIESEAEQDFSRCEVAHFVTATYAADYRAVFGSVPELASIPARCKPGDAAWAAMTEDERRTVDRVFTNTGKVIEAYVRQLVSRDSRLDRFLAGHEDALTPQEQRGAAIFVREDRGRCISCHDGPNLTDDTFHNLGVPQAGGELLQGRHEGIARLLADPLNGAGAYSDDPIAGARKLAHLVPLSSHLGAFKTPTLRDVTRRSPLGHLGQVTSLEDWIEFLDHGGGGGEPADRFAGTKEATIRRLALSRQDKADLRAFLGALEGEPLDAALIAPPR